MLVVSHLVNGAMTALSRFRRRAQWRGRKNEGEG